jgi:hypothetical protein
VSKSRRERCAPSCMRLRFPIDHSIFGDFCWPRSQVTRRCILTAPSIPPPPRLTSLNLALPFPFRLPQVHNPNTQLFSVACLWIIDAFSSYFSLLIHLCSSRLDFSKQRLFLPPLAPPPRSVDPASCFNSRTGAIYLAISLRSLQDYFR